MAEKSVISIRDHGALDLLLSLLEQGISVHIRVSGNSMKPLLNGGEIVEVAPLAEQHPKIGDILFLCDPQNKPLVHRLIRRRYYKGVLYLQTKGDAHAGFDAFVPADRVSGRIRRIIIPSDLNKNKGRRAEKKIDLFTPFMRFQACFIVSHTLILYYLRRIKILLKW